MTETTQTVFEKFQVRKTKKQKKEFRDYVVELAHKNGYDVNIQKTLFGAKNIVVGNVEKAKIIYTAHYDTCAELPFPNFITPKCFPLYLLYQIAVVLGILIPLYAIEFLIGMTMGLVSVALNFEIPYVVLLLTGYLVGIVFVSLLLFGPANKHTANDNTSGVTVLLDLISSIPQENDNVAFVFFDLEEAGTFGSAGFASKNKNVAKDKLVLNFDCVSDGDNIIFALKKGAIPYKEKIENAFESNEDITVEVLTEGVFYPSDQMHFCRGVGVAALKKAKRSKLLYMNRIHTRRDIIYREENIEFITCGAKKLLCALSDQQDAKKAESAS